MDFNDPLWNMLLTVICAVIASSGFWAFIQHKIDRNDASKKLLIGLAHDRIMWLGNQYIGRGWMTTDEYENFRVYLYDPYAESGGNGSAKRIMKEVDEKVRIVKTPPAE